MLEKYIRGFRRVRDPSRTSRSRAGRVHNLGFRLSRGLSPEDEPLRCTRNESAPRRSAGNAGRSDDCCTCTRGLPGEPDWPCAHGRRICADKPRHNLRHASLPEKRRNFSLPPSSEGQGRKTTLPERTYKMQKLNENTWNVTLYEIISKFKPINLKGTRLATQKNSRRSKTCEIL